MGLDNCEPGNMEITSASMVECLVSVYNLDCQKAGQELTAITKLILLLRQERSLEFSYPYIPVKSASG
jgi:hypothetical protein